MSFIVELWHCNYKTFINDDTKYLFRFLEVQFKTNFFCRDVNSISAPTLEWTYALNSMEPLFRRGTVTSLTPPWRLCAPLCFVFTLESAQQSATYKMVNNSYLSSPNGKAVATKGQTAGFRPLNMSGFFLSWGCDWSHRTFLQLHLSWSSECLSLYYPFCINSLFSNQLLALVFKKLYIKSLKSVIRLILKFLTLLALTILKTTNT